jgi:hypothetical protein
MRARARIGFLFPTLALLLPVSAPVAAWGQPAADATVDEARSHFKRGVAFYQGGDFRSALIEFLEAYRIVPNYRVLFDTGETYAQLGDYAGATKALREYLEEGKEDIPSTRRAQVQTQLETLEAHVARVDVDVDGPGARITCEGERKLDLGFSPLTEPVLLNPGEWQLSAIKAGYREARAQVKVAGGDRKHVSLVLEPLPRPFPVPEEALAPSDTAPPTPVPLQPPMAAPGLPRDGARSRSMVPVWVGLTTTAALAAGSGATGVLALIAKGDFDTKVNAYGTSPAQINEARDRTRTLAISTDILGGAAIAGAAITAIIYFVLREPRPDRVGWRFLLGPQGAAAQASY